MYSVRLIARYIIYLFDKAGINITNMELQKMTYFVQAWYLANYHEPMADCKFEAGVYGPVCRELYSQYKKFKKDPIEVKINPKIFNVIKDEDKKFIDEVVGAYNQFSSIELMTMSHDEAWQEARGDLQPDEQCNKIIENNRIEEIYSKFTDESET